MLHMRYCKVFLLQEGYRCLDVGKLNHFYGYSDKFLSVSQVSYFRELKTAMKWLPCRYVRRKKITTGYIASSNQKQKFAIIIV